jgi:hypothetical protein
MVEVLTELEADDLLRLQVIAALRKADERGTSRASLRIQADDELPPRPNPLRHRASVLWLVPGGSWPSHSSPTSCIDGGPVRGRSYGL